MSAKTFQTGFPSIFPLSKKFSRESSIQKWKEWKELGRVDAMDEILR